MMYTPAVRRALTLLLCLYAITLAGGQPAAAQEHQGKGVGAGFFVGLSPGIAKPKNCCLGDPDLKVTIGQSAKGTIYFTCKDTSTGEDLKDNVDISLFGAPRRHGEKAPVIDPNPSDTYPFNPNGSAITIDTVYKKDSSTDTTTPKNYTISVTGRSTLKDPPCQTYPLISAPLAVAPKILITRNDKNRIIEDVWWFNNEHPKNYDTVLSAQPPDEGGYDWSIFRGTAYAKIGTKTDNKVKIVGIKAPTAAISAAANAPQAGPTPSVDVTVKVGRVDSDPLTLAVRMPYSLEFVPCPRPSCDIADHTYGYLSFIGYRALDQHGMPLPHIPVPWNERFNPGFVYDPPWNANCPAAGSPPCWRKGIACSNPFTGQNVCGESDPNLLVDMIGGEAVGFGFVPAPRHPGATLGHTAVDHFGGAFYVGGTASGDGVEIQRHWWQSFQDHGRHTHIQSPPP